MWWDVFWIAVIVIVTPVVVIGPWALMVWYDEKDRE